MRTLRVTGKGQLKVHPDMTRLTITLEGMKNDYADTLRKSAEKTEALKDLLAPLGFERSELKTLRFDVNAEYESYKERDTYKQRFVGYKFDHVLKLEFDSDNTRLGIILSALAGSKLHPEFRISYTVKDPEAVKNELLGKAIRDAMAKADVLSGAAGLKLGDIQNVDYSWGRVDFEVQPLRDFSLNEACCLPIGEAGGCDLDIEPDDIEVQDTVTVVWEIG